jgi:hypothetical protein
MMSAAASVSPLASASGLPCSCVSSARDVAGALAHQAGGLAHDLAALGGRHVAPGLEALLRGLQRAVQVGRPLPKLADGPFAGYPRVFGLAWAFVAHTDSRFDPELLRRFVRAYQRVSR